MSKIQAIENLLISARDDVRRMEAMVASGSMAWKSEPPPQALNGAHSGGFPLPKCGQESLQKFAEAVAKESKKLTGRIPISVIYRIVGDEFARQCLEQKSPINAKFASAFLAASVAKCEQALESRRYYFPVFCLNENKVDKYEIGPVTFERSSNFFDRERKRWSTAVSKAAVGAAASKAGRQRYALVKKRLSKYQWIASIQIDDTDPSIAQSTAADIIDLSCFALRLVGPAGRAFIGLADSSNRRPAEFSFSLKARQFLIRTVDANIDINVSQGVLKQIKHIPGLDQIELALVQLASFSPISGAYSRLLTALRWFGEAWKDIHTDSRLVKFVFALEGLLMTGNKEGLAEQLAERVAMLLTDDFKERQQLFRQMKQLYGHRSKAVHGGTSKVDVHAREEQSNIAGKTAGDCICAYAQLCPYLIGDPENALRDFFEALKLGGRRQALSLLAKENPRECPPTPLIGVAGPQAIASSPAPGGGR